MSAPAPSSAASPCSVGGRRTWATPAPSPCWSAAPFTSPATSSFWPQKDDVAGEVNGAADQHGEGAGVAQVRRPPTEHGDAAEDGAGADIALEPGEAGGGDGQGG